MENILQNLFSTNLLADVSMITLLIGLIISFVQCFFGYKIIRSWIAIIGFLLGAITGYALVDFIFDNTTYALIGALVGAVLIAFLAYKVYLAGVFAISGLAAYSLCLTYLSIDPSYIQPVAIVIGIIVAIVAVKYMRPAIILITAIYGAFSAVDVLPTFIPFDRSMTLPIGIGFALAGVLVQFLTTKKN